MLENLRHSDPHRRRLAQIELIIIDWGGPDPADYDTHRWISLNDPDVPVQYWRDGQGDGIGV